MPTRLQAIQSHQQSLVECTKCKDMIGPVVTGQAVISSVYLLGQAPGDKEGALGRPFAWTAGKTLFKWFAEIGIDEAKFRQAAYMAAVCRCFPGKNPKGGDRVPNKIEIAHCRPWIDQELVLIQPKLILPIGKLAISQFLSLKKLDEVIGQSFHLKHNGGEFDLIPLPHPSGASTWHRKEPGKTLLSQALCLIERHSAWRQICNA